MGINGFPWHNFLILFATLCLLGCLYYITLRRRCLHCKILIRQYPLPIAYCQWVFVSFTSSLKQLYTILLGSTVHYVLVAVYRDNTFKISPLPQSKKYISYDHRDRKFLAKYHIRNNCQASSHFRQKNKSYLAPGLLHINGFCPKKKTKKNKSYLAPGLLHIHGFCPIIQHRFTLRGTTMH